MYFRVSKMTLRFTKFTNVDPENAKYVQKDTISL